MTSAALRYHRRLWLVGPVWPHLAGAALVAGAALLVGVPVAALVATVAAAALAGPGELWAALGRADVPALAGSVLVLAAGATAWALAAAVPLAWLAARTDLPGRGLVRALAPLPLAIPPYVAAIAYIVLAAPGGALHTWLAERAGLAPARVPWPRAIYGAGGAAFVLGLFTAPSVFLLVHAALARANPSLEEAARGLGCGPWATFRRVTLPLLRPALLAGALLVFAYACVDFGVVSLLRARTVTTAVYTYLLAGYSRPASAALSLLLVAGIWLAVAAQRRALGGGREGAEWGFGARTRRGAPPVRLGAWRWPALGYCVVVLALGLVVPVVVLAAQAARLGAGPLAAFWMRQVPYLANSLGVAAAGSTAALALGLALALARGRLAGAYPAALVVQAGYAIPGTVLGLALVGALASAAPAVYGTPAALALAYVVLFTTPALQACQAAVAQVTPALEAAARGLGSTPLDAVRRVVLPLAGPGVVAGWALVFALSVRELAASIVLRPAGFDTLAIRIWVHTMDVGPDPRAAAVALLLLVVVAAVWLAALAIGRPRAGEARG